MLEQRRTVHNENLAIRKKARSEMHGFHETADVKVLGVRAQNALAGPHGGSIQPRIALLSANNEISWNQKCAAFEAILT